MPVVPFTNDKALVCREIGYPLGSNRVHAAAFGSGRYVAMKRRTFVSVSGQTRRPLSSWLTNGLSLSANSPKREGFNS